MSRKVYNRFSYQKKDPQSKIIQLKQKINDQNYLYEAIQRIAQVLSNEITGIPRRGN